LPCLSVSFELSLKNNVPSLLRPGLETRKSVIKETTDMTNRSTTNRILKRLSLLGAAVLLTATISVTDGVTTQVPAAATPTSSMLDVDYRSLVSQADLFFTNPITDPNHGLPVGNGVMGSMVWTPDAQSLRMQVNRSDVFGSNEATNGANQQMNAAGNIKVNFGSDVFLPGTTMQHLRYYDGVEDIDANGIKASVLASKDQDVFALNITDNRATPQPISIDLSTIYASLVSTSGSNTATSTLTQESGKVVLKQVTSEISDTKSETLTDANDHYNASAVAVDVLGRTGTTSVVDTKKLRLSVPASSGNFTVLIGSAASMDSAVDVKAAVVSNVNTAKTAGYASILAAHTNRWHDFWSKSFVHFPGVAGTGYKQDYALHWINFYYLMGSSQGGNYASKFNGMVFNANNGLAQWGPMFWYFNQTRSYYGLETGNHPELLDPFLNMKSANIAKYEIAAQQQWGSSGLYTEEVEGYSGPEVLPDDVAASLQNSLLNGLAYSQAVLDFKATRPSVKASRWTVQAITGNKSGWHSHLVYDTADLANFYWDRYLFTRDQDWLEERAYPMIKGAAEFYRTFPNLKMGTDGKLHLHRTAFAETIWGGDDIINDLNYIRGVLKTAIKASTLLGVDASLRPLWQDVLDDLAPNPLSSDANALLPWPTSPAKPTYALGHTPAIHIYANRTAPSVWDEYQIELLNYDQVNLETHARSLDETAWNLNHNTLETQEAYGDLNSGTSPSLFANGASWSRFMSDVAMMGRSDMVKKALTSYLAFWQNGINSYPNRLPTVAQDNGVSSQEDGVFTEGMQTALLQSNAPGAGSDQPVIYVFPAWPKDTDATFQLAAKEGFTVTSSLRNETIEFVELASKLGEQAEVNNPWKDSQGTYQSVDVYRDGVKDAGSLTGRLLTIDTTVGENIVLVKTGTVPDTFKRTISYPTPINAWMQTKMQVGATDTVKLATSGDLTGATKTYTSSNPTIASVSSTGVVTALSGGQSTITAQVTYPGGGTASSSVVVAVTPKGVTYLSDLAWTSATSGWGTVQKDKGVTGVPMRIGTTSYAKGIGTHATSTISYNLGGGYSRFVSDVGVDEGTNAPAASVVFKVIADGTEIYNSGTVTAAMAAVRVDEDITGVNTLQLVVADAGDGINSDHGDWANAALHS
jgi:hypothetical protein